jgi:hypothetical protein
MKEDNLMNVETGEKSNRLMITVSLTSAVEVMRAIIFRMVLLLELLFLLA